MTVDGAHWPAVYKGSEVERVGILQLALGHGDLPGLPGRLVKVDGQVVRPGGDAAHIGLSRDGAVLRQHHPMLRLLPGAITGSRQRLGDLPEPAVIQDGLIDDRPHAPGKIECRYLLQHRREILHPVPIQQRMVAVVGVRVFCIVKKRPPGTLNGMCEFPGEEVFLPIKGVHGHRKALMPADADKSSIAFSLTARPMSGRK